jgi:hypothetical protein
MTARAVVMAGTALFAAAVAAACSRHDVPTSLTNGTANATAAAQFNQMGDSVLAAGGSASDAAPFFGAAGVIGRAPGIQTISVTVDGTATTMNAVAVAVEIFGGAMIACPVPAVGTGTAAPFVCPWGIPRVTRTLFAWAPTKPRQIVTLIASTDSGSIGTPIPIVVTGSETPVGMGTAAGGTMEDSATSVNSALTRPIPAHLEYRRGWRTWWGISGTQMNTVKPTGASCWVPPANAMGDEHPDAIPFAMCQLADFTFAFNGTVARPPVAIWGDTLANMSTTHTVGMTLTPITGVYFKLLTPGVVTTP